MTWPRYSLRTILLLMAASVPLGWFAAQFTRVEKQYVDPATGALKQTTSYCGMTINETIEPTALERWLAERGQGQTRQWQFIGSRSWNCFACGYLPPVYYLRGNLPRVLKLLSQDEVLALVQTLRTGTHDEQMAAVEVIEKRLAAAP